MVGEEVRTADDVGVRMIEGVLDCLVGVRVRELPRVREGERLRVGVPGLLGTRVNRQIGNGLSLLTVGLYD